MPAPKPISLDTYRGRVAARLRKLRNGRDVERLVGAMAKAGFEIRTSRTYYNWERGDTDPPIEAFPSLAKALRVSVHDLFPLR